jgi:hypothetical protein
MPQEQPEEAVISLLTLGPLAALLGVQQQG